MSAMFPCSNACMSVSFVTKEGTVMPIFSRILKFILMVFTNLYNPGSCQPEGFVIRTVEQFPYDYLDKHVAKFVRAGHVQTEESWKRTWRQAKLNKLC